MSKTRKALLHTATAQYVAMAIQFVVSVVIARLLLPEEVGIFSVAAIAVLLAQTLSDLGANQYLVVTKELTNNKIRAAFTVSLAVGWLLALVCLLCAPLLADFYESKGVGEVMSLLALNFALLPFGTVPSAVLKREMDFKPASIARAASAFMQAAVTISCAANGFSYMSMAWGGIASTVTSMLIINYFRPPGLPFLPGLNGLKSVLSFGYQSTSISILQKISSSVPEMVVGKTLGFHAAGLFSRTSGTMGLFASLVLRAVNPVLAPYYASAKRQNADVRETYLLVVTYLTGVAWPFFGAFFFISPYFVETLFGPNWLEIIPLIQILCIGPIFYHLTSTLETFLTSIGRIDRSLRITAMISASRLIILIPAAFFSLTTLAIATAAMPLFRLSIAWRDIKQHTHTDTKDYYRLAWRSGQVAVLPTVTAAFVHYFVGEIGQYHPIFPLLLGAAGSFLAYIISIQVSSHPLRTELAKVYGLILKK